MEIYTHPNSLRKFEIFKSLSEEQLKDLSSVVQVIEIEKLEKVYQQGDAISHVYLLIKGCVKLGSLNGGERLLIKNIIYDNEVFGENIFSAAPRSEFAEAHKDSIILSIPVDTMRVLIMTSGTVAGYITNIMIERIKGLEERMESFVFKKAKNRITDFIKSSGLQRGIKIGLDEFLINHGMSHKDIAYLTDTSRQTVARVLSELKNDNIIHFSSRKANKILIKNMAAL